MPGGGFDTDRTRNVTSLNGSKVQVTGAEAGELRVKLAPGPAFGQVKVVNPGGSAGSAGDVVAGTYQAAVVGVPADAAVTTSPDAAPAEVAIVKPGQNGTLTFTGTAGQRIFTRLTVPADAPSCALDVRLAAPDGAELSRSTCLYDETEYVDTITLPADGAYTYKINPKDAWTGTPTLQVLNVPADVVVPTTPDAAPAAVAITKPGQGAAVTFTWSRWASPAGCWSPPATTRSGCPR